MKLGLGLYRHMLTRENFQFAREAAATQLVIHLVDYFKRGAHNPRDNQPTGTDQGWGLAGDPNQLWTVEELVTIRKAIEAERLKLEAIENFARGPKEETATRKHKDDYPPNRASRHTDYRLQFQHRWSLRAGQRPFCARWSDFGWHGWPAGHAHPQWHGLEHGL